MRKSIRKLNHSLNAIFQRNARKFKLNIIFKLSNIVDKT